MSILRPDSTLAAMASRLDPTGRESRPVADRPPRLGAHRTGETCVAAHVLLEALATGDTGGLEEAVASDVRARTPTFHSRDRAGLIRGIGKPAQAFDRVVVSVSCLECGEADFGAEWEVEARHSGVLTAGWAALEPSGRTVIIEGALIGHHRRDGVITAFALYYNEMSLIEQLGLL